MLTAQATTTRAVVVPRMARRGFRRHQPPQTFPATDWARQDGLVGEEAAQVFGESVRAVVALAQVLPETFQTDRFQIARHGGLQFGGRQWFAVADEFQRLQLRRRAEGRSAGEQFVEDDAEAVDVGTRPDLLKASLGLLRRHVGWRAQDGAAVCMTDVLFEALWPGQSR